jgi:hypothetical protein
MERGSLRKEGTVHPQSTENVSMIWDKRIAFLGRAFLVLIMQIFSGNLTRHALSDNANFPES